MIFGADAPPIRIDAPFVELPTFDARILDARPRPDAGPQFQGDRFDVAYVSEWTLGANANHFTADDLAIFVNTGSTNLNMKDLSILEIINDNPSAQFIYQLNSPAEDRILAPDTSYGANGNQHVSELIAALVTEPNDSREPTVEVVGGFDNVPGGGDIHIKVRILIGEQVANLPFLIHRTGSGDALVFNKASRISSVSVLPDAGVPDAPP